MYTFIYNLLKDTNIFEIFLLIPTISILDTLNLILNKFWNIIIDGNFAKKLQIEADP